MRDPDEGLDETGAIRTGVGRHGVPPGFSVVLDTVVAAFDARARPGWGLYAYGSVATGRAVLGRSDVDLLVIDATGSGGAQNWAASVGAASSTEFATLCRAVEIGAGSAVDYTGEDDEAYGNRVFLRHYCSHLAGDDRLRPDHDFPGDARAARGFNGDIGWHLERWRGTGTPDRRIARKILLAAAGLVSVRNHTWTTDRTAGADLLGVQETALDDELHWLAAIAETPTDGSLGNSGTRSARMTQALRPGGAVARIAELFESEIGLWAATR